MPLFPPASGGSSTISSPPVLMLNSVPEFNSDSFEYVFDAGKVFISAKKNVRFSLPARNIALADSEYNWTWDNRAEVASGNENSTTANACRLVAGSGTSDWFAGPYTAARRYKTYQFSTSATLKPKVLIARISNNASTNYTGTGIQITDSADDANFVRYQVGFAAAAEKIISYVGTSPNEVACTSSNLADGIWLRITLDNGNIYFDHNLSTVATPPPASGWVRDRVATWALDISKTYQIGLVQIVNAVSSGLLSDILYYCDAGLTNDDGETENPVWCAQGYDTETRYQAMIIDWDKGTANATVSETGLRSVLNDIVSNYELDDTSGAQFSAWLSSSPLVKTSGIATGGGSTTLSDSTAAWNTNALAGLTIRTITGTGAGQTKTVSSNTGTQITVNSSWSTNPDATTTYQLSGTFDTPGNVVVGGSGRYFTLWHSFASSTGIRKCSVYPQAIIPLVST